jgi:hypothetical protein
MAIESALHDGVEVKKVVEKAIDLNDVGVVDSLLNL